MMSTKIIAGSMAQLLGRQWPSVSSVGSVSFLHTAAVLEAARKGTRAKALARKKASKKVVVEKKYIPLKKRLALLNQGKTSPRRVDGHLKDATDDVYFTKYYRRKVYSFAEAITMHREAHHETMLNANDTHLYAYIEMKMNLDRKNRYMEEFREVVMFPHYFDFQHKRKVMVVAENEDIINYANEAGVSLVVGKEIIKQAQDTPPFDFTIYRHILAEIGVLPELSVIRGLMKKQFPSTKRGTAAFDIKPLIELYMKGVEVRAIKNKFHENFGTVTVPFGKLNMTNRQLEENLDFLLQRIHKRKENEKKSDDLISMVAINSLRSHERFKINHHEHIENVAKAEVEAEVEAQ